MGSALRTGAATITACLIALATSTGVGAGAPLAPIVPSATCAKAPGQGLTLANIAADGSRLVAVGSNGLIATSSKPSAWTVRPTPVQHDLRGAVWTGSRWVVVGDLGTILSSPDGHMWQAANGIPPVGLRAVAARSGLVVAAGAAGALVSSPDGQNWTKQTSGTTEILWGGTALGSNVLVSGKDATVLASSDGSSWRAIPTHPFATGDPAAPRPFLWQLAADGSRLVAVGDFGAVLEGTLTSLTAVHSPTDEILRGVTFGRGVGVAVGSSGMILRSVAAGRWTTVDSPTTVDLRGVAYTGSRFVAVGDESTVISSTDGLHWHIDTTAMPCALVSIARGAGSYVAVGGSGQVLSSADGRRWQAPPRPTRQDLYAVAYGPYGFVAAGAGGTVLQSTDGRRWRARRVETSLNLHAVAWTGHDYLIGGDRGLLFESANGSRWQRVSILAFHSIRDFATAGTTTIAVGAGTVARRSAGGRWTLESIGFGRFQTSVAAGAGRFVVVGHNGEALVSTDAGLTWTPGTTGAAINLDRVIYADGRFIATGEGLALASADGLHWRSIKLPTPRSIRAIAVTRSVLVAVGDLRTVLRSTDGGTRWSVVKAPG